MTVPMNSAVDIVVRAIWATLDRKERDYLKDLEREVFTQVKAIIQFNQQRDVVVIVRRELSPNAQRILELQGFPLKLHKDRYVREGVVCEIYRNALILENT